MELLVGVISGLIATLLLWWISSRKGKRPPGPWGLPFVGYLPFLTSKPYLTLTKLAKKYGNVFRFRLGSVEIVVLNDYQSTKEAFSQDACMGRPEGIFELSKETLETGAFFGLGWKEHRRHCLHLLRELGLGKTKMEDQIQEEIAELLEHLEKNADRPFSMRLVLGASMSNNIASLMFGKRMKYDDPIRQKMTKMIREIASEIRQVSWQIFFPWLRKLMTFLHVGVPKFSEHNVFFQNFVKNEINEHDKTFNQDNIRDFIDGYLLEIKRRKNDPTFSKPMLQDLVGTFFGAGSETVRSSIEWLMLGVASHPKSQQRIYEEIQNVIGERSPVSTDQRNMPYTNAFIMEMQRWRTLIPINLLRYTISDTTINGYFIPKHTRIMSNHWAIHHDPEYWGPDADEFKPERFLTEDGKEVKKFDHYIPFSIGKRSCPGESLAKVEIFLYFASILQKFHVKMPDGKTADFDGMLGIGLDPKPQDIVLTKRI